MPEMVYGRQPVREVLRAERRQVFAVYLAAGVHDSQEVREIRARAEQQGVRIRETTRGELDRLTSGANHQGVLALTNHYPYVDFDLILSAVGAASAHPLLLFVDHIQDPQNLGSLLRSAEAVGVMGVIIPEDRAVHVSPAVVRVSAGATEYLQICKVTNLVRAMREMKAAGVWIVGLDNREEARGYAEQDLTGPLGIVVGSEGKGLSRLVRETCDFIVRVPMFGRLGSLNAAVATAVVLYEAWRQRKKGDS
ncbi:MAG: 23S rRNA (guanosine(2251)-2'-O)-methyltransferase RlmB [Kiritimatiellia bacterium]